MLLRLRLCSYHESYVDALTNGIDTVENRLEGQILINTSL